MASKLSLSDLIRLVLYGKRYDNIPAARKGTEIHKILVDLESIFDRIEARIRKIGK